ncbi:MAG: hypothetical protein AABX10_01350, partial [Nanoarchaeota archaeon]
DNELTKKDEVNILKNGAETGLFFVYQPNGNIYELKIGNEKIGFLDKSNRIITDDSAFLKVIKKYSGEDNERIKRYYRELLHATINGDKIFLHEEKKVNTKDKK